MSFRRLFPVAGLALLSIVLVNLAAADTVNLKYIGLHNSRTYFSMDGSTKYKELMSDSYDNKLYSGSNWTANVMPLLTGIAQGMFGPSMALDYKAAGLIYRSMLSNKLTAAQAQWSIWGLFSTNAQNTQQYAAVGGASIDATFLALAQTAPTKDYNGLFLYAARSQGRIRTDGVYRLYLLYGSRARQLDIARHRTPWARARSPLQGCEILIVSLPKKSPHGLTPCGF